MAAPQMCQRHLCDQPGVYECECCKESRHFCAEHGTVGGDVDGDDTVASYAVPSACWKCGGWDEWEGMTDDEIRAFLVELEAREVTK